MSTNTNVTIPGLFQFPPSLESELVAGRRRHDSEEMHLPYNHLEGIPEYYKQTGAFVARRLSTSMIASSSTAGGAGPSGRGQGFSSPVRHQSLTASGLRSNAIARPANPPREGTAPLGQRDAYPILHLQSHSHSHSHPYHLFLPNHLPQPSSLHAHAQSLSPPLLAAPPPPPSSASPPFASAPRMLAPPHGAHPHAPHTFAYPSADGDGDMYMNMRAASHEERYPSDDLAYPSASPPHFLATHAEEDVVKQEDPAQDEPMMWAHNAFYPPASSVESPYTEQLVDEPMEEPMYDVDVKSEPYNGYAHVGAVDGNVIDESWNNVLTYAEEPQPSSAPLCIDTSAAVSHDYSTLPFGPGIDMFSDRALDAHNAGMHQHSFYQQYQQHSPSPGPSLHTIPPPPSSQTRSYTLEGAITPISPTAPANAPFASASASSLASAHGSNRQENANQPLPTSSAYLHMHRALSPPPMGSLQPPSPHKQATRSNPHLHSYPQQVTLEPSTAPASHAAGRHTPPGPTVTTTSTYSTATSANTTPSTDFSAATSSNPQHPSIPTSAPVPTPAPTSAQAQTRTQVAPVQKRPRGRPRKNPPGAAARVSSPPPAVDYPFPHFPDSHPASSSASSGSYPGNGSGRGGSGPRSAGGKGTTGREDLEEAAILPPMSDPLPTLTVGTVGSTGPLPSSSTTSVSSHPHTSSGTSGGSGSSKAHGNVPPGLTAGQGIFKLNVPNDAESEGADGSGATGAGGTGSRSSAGGKGVEGEKKKPIMACLFCRERKIACGPPPPGAPRRCNQCTRRDLICEYPKESRRGQHKRGARAARVEALASGAAAAAASASGSTSQASSSSSNLNPEGSNAAGKAKANERAPVLTVIPGAVSFPSPGVVSPPPPPSPLTPLSSPAASGSSASSAATERPSRSEKICIERAGRSGSSGEGRGQAGVKGGKGKERSQSRAPAREAWGDTPLAAARRVLQQQQKKRAVTGATAAMVGSMAYLGASGSGGSGDEMSGVEMGMTMGMGAGGSSELSYAFAAGAMGAPQMNGMGR